MFLFWNTTFRHALIILIYTAWSRSQHLYVTCCMKNFLLIHSCFMFVCCRVLGHVYWGILSIGRWWSMGLGWLNRELWWASMRMMDEWSWALKIGEEDDESGQWWCVSFGGGSEDDGWGGWWVRMMDKTKVRVWGEWERGESTRVSFWERENECETAEE